MIVSLPQRGLAAAELTVLIFGDRGNDLELP
jgi:hypothetical protein